MENEKLFLFFFFVKVFILNQAEEIASSKLQDFSKFIIFKRLLEVGKTFKHI